MRKRGFLTTELFTVTMNIPDDVVCGLDVRSRTILYCCSRWFSQDTCRSEVLLRILQRKSGYSLRTVDWMVTNYSKRFPLTVVYNSNPVNVHDDYERHLSVYNKRYYDPFARRNKVSIVVLGVSVTTTVGQLNFFKWFIDRRLDQVVTKYKEHIEWDMKGVDSAPTCKGSVVMYTGKFSAGFVPPHVTPGVQGQV